MPRQRPVDHQGAPAGERLLGGRAAGVVDDDVGGGEEGGHVVDPSRHPQPGTGPGAGPQGREPRPRPLVPAAERDDVAARVRDERRAHPAGHPAQSERARRHDDHEGILGQVERPAGRAGLTVADRREGGADERRAHRHGRARVHRAGGLAGEVVQDQVLVDAGVGPVGVGREVADHGDEARVEASAAAQPREPGRGELVGGDDDVGRRAHEVCRERPRHPGPHDLAVEPAHEPRAGDRRVPGLLEQGGPPDRELEQPPEHRTRAVAHPGERLGLADVAVGAVPDQGRAHGAGERLVALADVPGDDQHAPRPVVLRPRHGGQSLDPASRAPVRVHCSCAGEPSFIRAHGLLRPVIRTSPRATSAPAIMSFRRRDPPGSGVGSRAGHGPPA